MPHQPTPLAGAAGACLLAGPVFLWSNGAAHLYLTLPAPIIVDPSAIPALILMSLTAVVVGALLSLVPILIGTTILFRLGSVLDFARAPAVWAVVGAASGAGLAAAAGVHPHYPAACFGLAAAGAMCAIVARRAITFD